MRTEPYERVIRSFNETRCDRRHIRFKSYRPRFRRYIRFKRHLGRRDQDGRIGPYLPYLVALIRRNTVWFLRITAALMLFLLFTYLVRTVSDRRYEYTAVTSVGRFVNVKFQLMQLSSSPNTTMATPSKPTSNQSSTRAAYQPISLELDDSLLYDEPSGSPETSFPIPKPSLIPSFWLLGLFNNASYVIMIASAKSISEGGTALVFLANIVPSLSIKLSAPYWFHRVSYKVRIRMATLCMVTSFFLVATATGIVARFVGHAQHRPGSDGGTPVTAPIWMVLTQLLGVAFGSAQCGLGEASLLALAGKFDASITPHTATATTSTTSTHNVKGHCLTAFSSGTGMAGVFGFFWKWFWTDFLGFSLSTTLWLAMVLAGGYLWCFQEVDRQLDAILQTSYGDSLDLMLTTNEPTDEMAPSDEDALTHESQSSTFPIIGLTATERFKLVIGLWPYTIPLFAVYAAEYSLQSGAWTAIGFPVDSVPSRDQFYEFSNWILTIKTV